MISSINFRSITPNNMIKRIPFSEQDKQNIEHFYKKYQKEANITSLQDIQKIIKGISAELHCSKEKVLTAMQQITQFANIESLSIITKALTKNKVFAIGNRYGDIGAFIKTKTDNKNFINTFSDDSGLPITLTYLLEEKKLTQKKYFDEFKHTKYMSVFLDKNRIKDFEKLKKSDPELFHKIAEDKKIKYFYLSGWDTGITVLDRNKNLESMTKDLIRQSESHKIPTDKTIDKPYLDRIKALGINPIIIKNEGLAKETSVYNQLRNYTMTKNELYNLIEANSLTKNKNSKMNSACINYIDNNLHLYTPEKLASSLKQIHSKIIDRAKEKNISEQDIIYVVPDIYYRGLAKSFNLINYSYEKVNNIEHDKFATIKDLKNNNLKNKMLVFLDDCNLSGCSVQEILDYHVNDLKELTPKHILFASVIGTNRAKTKVFKHLKDLNLGGSALSLDITTSPKTNMFNNKRLKKTVGKAQFSLNDDSYCIAFPYMSPDNNSEFATNLALEHNYFYRHYGANDFPITNYHGIKNITQSVIDVANKKRALIGYEPIQTEPKKENFSVLKCLKSFFS